MLRGTFWLKVVWSPPGWRRPKTLVEAASDWDLSQRLPVKREPTKVPRERHGRNPGHSWPGGCQRHRRGRPGAGAPGRRAAERLFSRLSGNEGSPQTEVLATRLIVRGSGEVRP